MKTAVLARLAVRFLASLGLGASALLLWDYVLPAPTFCAAGEGCDLVRLSPLARVLGVPTPVFGVGFFAWVLALTLLRRPAARLVLRGAGAAGGLVGVALILAQAFVVRAFCVYCVIVDVAAVAIAVVLWWRREPVTSAGREAWSASLIVFLVGFGVPFGVGLAKRKGGAEPAGSAAPGVAACIAQEQMPGAVTIVEFTDFECPYCRMQHFALGRLLDEIGGGLGKPVRIVRKHFPLPAHQNARPAARAAICAEEQGRGELMADLLFSADSVPPAALEAAATQLAMRLDVFRACVDSGATAGRLADDMTCGAEAGIEALPTMFVGTERLAGLQKDAVLVAALRRAARAAGVGAAAGPP